MQTVKELMQEGFTMEETTDLIIEAHSRSFDKWKDEQKEKSLYHNPLVIRDA